MLPAHQVAAAAAYVPNKKVGTLDHGDGHFFCGSYSADGLVYMSACQSTAARSPPCRAAQRSGMLTSRPARWFGGRADTQAARSRCTTPSPTASSGAWWRATSAGPSSTRTTAPTSASSSTRRGRGTVRGAGLTPSVPTPPTPHRALYADRMGGPPPPFRASPVHLCNVYMTEGSEVHLPLLMVYVGAAARTALPPGRPTLTARTVQRRACRPPPLSPPNIGYHSICLFSIKFSPDSREILGGSSANCIHLYNVERQAVVSMVRPRAALAGPALAGR